MDDNAFTHFCPTCKGEFVSEEMHANGLCFECGIATLKVPHIEDVQERKAQAKFDAWRKRWQWLAWSTKHDQAELPAFIDRDTRASNNEVQHANS